MPNPKPKLIKFPENLLVPLPLKKAAPKEELCTFCNRKHIKPGAYLCLLCGKTICNRMACGEIKDTQIDCHMVVNLDGKQVKCGPAIRISATTYNKIRLRKLK